MENFTSKRTWKMWAMRPKAHAGPRAVGDGEWRAHRRTKTPEAKPKKEKKDKR
jgi:hypothetical protein